jgi:CheY-like chemotaxis protein/nitrogen-specific signal transduction histidine kinase
MRDKPLILDVDDDEAGQYAVGRQLRQAGYEVIGASNGQSALRLAESRQPDLILLDVRLPDIDGFEVCKRIRATPQISGTPIVQMSASYIDTNSRVKGLDNGADAYLTEPVEPAILLATVNSLLRMKRAEQKVRQGARQWQTTFDAIQEGVALLDANGAAIQHNKAFVQVLGVAFLNFPALTQQIFEDARATGLRQVEEQVLDNKALTITMDPIADDDKQFTGAVCTVADVTERKNFDQQLRHTAKLESIGVLAGGIAHDFNNLLTGILGNSSLLMETLPAGAPELELADEIMKASESAADLTRQILAYSGKGRFVVKIVDLSAVALDTRAFVRRFIPSKVELVYQLASDLPTIQADQGQMQQLTMNLIINAAESFGEGVGGKVTVATGTEHLEESFFRGGESRAPGDYVTLTVSDNGSGMDEETQSRIFDPFFTTKFAGRGLGLSAVHGILRGHAGYLRLRSQPGGGTTFRLYFPADKIPASKTPVPQAVSAGRISGTILVVDDESTVRNFAKIALQKRGYSVLVAESGEECVALLLQPRNKVDLVLLDLTMPAMSGEEAFEQVRRIDPAVPVILSSGFSHATAAERFQGKNISGFLGKPYTGAQLGDAVLAAMKSPRVLGRA